MSKSASLVVAVCCFGLMGGALRVSAEEKTETVAEKKAAVTQSAFVCPHCHTLAMNAGKCGMCEKEMKERHVLGVKDGNAMVCACDAACTCNAAGMKDGKCGCGKEVKTVSTKGKYVCPDGCPMNADKTGKCACGKKLKKTE